MSVSTRNCQAFKYTLLYNLENVLFVMSFFIKNDVLQYINSICQYHWPTILV